MTMIREPMLIRADLPGGYLRALEAEQQAITAVTVRARQARLPAIGPPRVVEPARVVSDVDASWRVRANCLGVDPELFYPGPWDQPARDEALAVCGSCVVRASCLAAALERDETFGIWGGTTERQRRRLRRSLPRWAVCHGCGGRYVKEASGQRYCGDECRGVSLKHRREVASNPGRRMSSRSRPPVAS